MTRTAWAGTITAHAILIALLAWCVPARVVPDAVTATVELLAVPAAAADPEPAPVPAPAPSTATATATATAAAVRHRGRDRGPAPGPVAAIEAEGGGGGRGGGGPGGGFGVGRGDGGGLGARAGGPSSSETPPAPRPIALRPEPPPSKARPARLIWPARNRKEREGAVFVFHVKIDDDGYVQGARLVRGVSRRADAEAEAGVWRFRYAPALDDAGRPIASELDQPLMIE